MPKCKTCKFFTLHSAKGAFGHLGDCDITFPRWVTRDNYAVVRVDDSCDLHKERSDA